ncbi:alpha/beta hydrolase [Propionibacterium sp. NM47_B9-13]|uniref:AB hydrolase-1 domain-containing protein n=1 Tax=Cutibacterium modestum TaxID=2559073 RepID=A0AAD1NW02_9ACTN|nr:alpha/beta hydrolase [Cutibacterium modestum]MCP2375467.1 putative hydrolase [Cutibacterium modestum 28N]MCP2379712.1 putative hydrolase [Cutibacterium modestum 30N]TGY27603.1 alpha/beta hydrolase [Propionibacterium sp. NM47_B9-13]AOH44598.1 alpha/beta hydrolase [Cutibacterium modestum]EFS75195.1 hydrolase, alpha/beta domain protein [Cutibacterium modestum HL037PA2]
MPEVNTDLPVVAVHGITSSPTTWGGLVLALNVEGVVVHQLSLLGHGPADTRRGVGTDYPLEAFAADVIEQMDALKVDKCALVGHSLGALISSMVAQRQPDRFDRVLLEDMPVLRRVRRDAPPMRRYADAILMEVAALAGRKRFDPTMVWKVSRELLKPNPQWWDGLSRMIMPVLVIGGGKGSYLRQDRLREVVNALPDARIVTIDGGHRTHITKGDEFCDIAVPFLTNGKYVNRRHNGVQDM